MLFRTYQNYAWETNRTREDHRFLHMQMGFTNESSDICNLVKEARREQFFENEVALNPDEVNAEIGDSLWYLAALHTISGKQLGSALPIKRFEELDAWAEGQPVSAQIDATQNLYSSFVRLSAETDIAKKSFPDETVNEYLKSLALFARNSGTSLNKAAEYNLEKISDRYIGDQQWPQNTAFEDLGVKVFEFIYTGEQVSMLCDGQPLGDPLTDQTVKPDKFKDHDPAHIALAVLVHWSPVMRKLMGKKRNDDLDGARHVITEEKIILDTHNFYKSHNNRKGLGWNLLVNICDAVAEHPEAEQITSGQWERALVTGFDFSRQLADHKGGCIITDFRNKEMTLDFAV